MSDKLPVFVVKETGERPVIAFRDWDVVRHRLFYLEEAYVAGVKKEVEQLFANNRCDVVAIDMAGVDVVPSTFLAVLVALSAGELRIELLNASKSFLRLLETTKIGQFVVCRDAESSPIGRANGGAD
jgi:anti-anti-sigma regulatory factor